MMVTMQCSADIIKIFPVYSFGGFSDNENEGDPFEDW